MKRTLLECKSCLVSKDESEFYLLKGKPQLSRCRPCKNQYQRDRLKDPSKLEEKKRQEAKAYQRDKVQISAKRKALRNTSVPHRIAGILQNSRGRAEVKGFSFSISQSFLEGLYRRQAGICALSGEALEAAGDRYLSNLMSLDRVDSSLGYTEDNVQWVCVKYNMMKAHATQDEFVEMCRRVVENSSA